MGPTREGYVRDLESAIDREWRMLIAGELVEAEGSSTMPIASPYDGKHLADVPLASEGDVARAVAAAQAAFPGWRDTPLLERAALVKRFAQALERRGSLLGVLDAATVGNPVTPMLADIQYSVMQLEYQCGVAFEVKGQTLPSQGRSWLLTRREPYGVVGRIAAYNHPLLFAAMKLGPPVLMGNTLVLKVPDQSPLSALLLADAVREIFPPGVVNIVSGTGAVTGDALVRHPAVKRLSLIGSIGTGQRIQASAATAAVKHVSLELGGKNPFIVCPDADIDAAVAGAAAGMNCQFEGQSCGSTSRLFLHESVHDAFVEKLARRLERVRIGHPLDPATEMGCLVSRAHFDRVMGYVNSAKQEGARLVTGGTTPSEPELSGGPYLRPTVFADVDMSMRIAREEIFGPVLSVLKWNDLDDAVDQANAVPYGLTGAVWTRDIGTALSVAERLDTGYVWVNGAGSHFLGAPFSGHKNSGTDSEEGIEELISYTQLKTINIPIG